MSLALRLSAGEIALVIAGPILRRVEKNSVSVWIALRESRSVRLTLVDADNDPVAAPVTQQTKRFGRNLYIALVTVADTNAFLAPGQIYYYKLEFIEGGTTEQLSDPGVLHATLGGAQALSRIIYPKLGRPALPCFSLPPSDLRELRIVHGSCRKPHGPSLDAMSVLDDMLGVDAHDATNRPHQLFLTGDQIYADDVADALLHLLMESAEAVIDNLNSHEELTEFVSAKTAFDFLPGRREDLIVGEVDRGDGIKQTMASFTTTEGRSHLVSLGEFLSMYLFVWSDELWPRPLATIPEYEAVYGEDHPRNLAEYSHPDFVRYETQRVRVQAFARLLPKVRRAIANVPTYMLPDDHEVTDDWNLHRGWAERVFGKPLARRIIRNALASYVICQDWGNKPTTHAASTGADFLDKTSAWIQSDYSDAAALMTMNNYLPLPPNSAPPAADDDFPRSSTAGFSAHYTIAWEKHQVIALDTRTWRSFPKSDRLRAVVMSQEGLVAQFQDVDTNIGSDPNDFVTIVLLAGPPATPRSVAQSLSIGTSVVGFFTGGESASYKFEAYLEGVEQEPALLERLFARLAARRSVANRAERMVFFSGDVHHSYAASLRYWAERPVWQQDLPQPAPDRADAAMAFFTSSGFRNETELGPISFSRIFHSVGHEFDLFRSERILPSSRRLSWSLDSPAKNLDVGSRQIAGLADGTFFASAERNQKFAIIENTDDAVVYYNAAAIARTPPDVIADIEFKTSIDVRPLPDFLEVGVSTTEHLERLSRHLDAQKNHEGYSVELEPGKQIVGMPNLAIVRFEGFDPNDSAAERAAVQEHWWWKLDADVLFKVLADGTVPVAEPLTKFRVSLSLLPSPSVGVLK
jgi:hypothetical protein